MAAFFYLLSVRLPYLSELFIKQTHHEKNNYVILLISFRGNAPHRAAAAGVEQTLQRNPGPG